MTFLEIVNAVLAESFDETDRDEAEQWTNARYGELWDMNEWSFKNGHANVTVTANSGTVTNLPADFGTAVSLQRFDGSVLRAHEEWRDFASLYLGTANAQAGVPSGWTVQDGVIYVGPISSETSSTYLLGYEKAATEMTADGESPLIPWQYHLALVHGAKAEGATLRHIQLDGPFEAKWQAAIRSMERNYLTELRGAVRQTPAFRPC